jgi:hypothetical protein
MANPQPLFARPADDIYTLATLTLSNPDPAYPISNTLIPDPAIVAKSLEQTTDLHITVLEPAQVVGVALINTNAQIADIDGVPIPIPGYEFGGLGPRLNPWCRLTLDSSEFEITLTHGDDPIWIGNVLLLVALRPFNLRYGLQFGTIRPGRTVMTTRLGTKLIHDAGIRQRTAKGLVDLREDEDTLRSLEANARGSLLPWLFIPDETINDAWYVRFQNDEYTWTYPTYDVSEIPITIEELSPGPADG